MAVNCLKCNIAELNIKISTVCSDCRLITQSREYTSDFKTPPDFEIEFTEDFLQKRVAENPQISLSEAEYIWTGYEFCRQLLNYNGIVLHASAVSYRGKAYLFSAPSGTGKSTHVRLWKKVFGDEAIIINDDKPALRFSNGKLMVFGTPWSGKSDENANISVPLGGICFISRGKENFIEKTDTKFAAASILGQTLRYPSVEFMDKLLSFIDCHLPSIPTFRMECNLDDEAAESAYEFMNKHSKGE